MDAYEERPTALHRNDMTPSRSETDAAERQVASLARPGLNCCRQGVATKGAVLVDGADYFEALEDALRQAQRSIFIIGWDFDGRIRLRPPESEDDSPPLGVLLYQLADARPELEIHILIWSTSVLHAPGSSQEMILGADWQKHPRIHLRLATDHPVYAAHHQKIVAIDDALAFTGGIDLTIDRWDTHHHRPDDPLRATPDGERYPPVHDLQIALAGEPAAILASVARERWRGTTGETLPAPKPGRLWLTHKEADFQNVPVSVARTMPGIGRRQPVHESASQLLDIIKAARRSIYIEAQYMTAFSIGIVLARRLREKNGPEVVIVMSYEAHGLLERWIMQANRDRLIRFLRKADRHDRLRILYPCVSGKDGGMGIFVHSKLLIADDQYFRIGSSNLNNRSIGLDSECDVLLEASDAASRSAIAAIRHRLLAEHLGTTRDSISRKEQQTGSMIDAIEASDEGQRSLRPFDALSDNGPARPMPGTWFLDPKRPFGLLSYLLPYRHKRRKIHKR